MSCADEWGCLSVFTATMLDMYWIWESELGIYVLAVWC